MSKRQRRHLEGTEHANTPGARTGQTGQTIRVPRTPPKPWIDARVLLVAATIASPAAYRSSQGLLSTSDALHRFLEIAIGCVVVSVLLRAIWPIVAGEGDQPTSRTVAGVALPSATADAVDEDLLNDAFAGVEDTGIALDPAFGGPADLTGLPGLTDLAMPPAGGGLDLLESDVDPTALLELP